MPTLAEFLKSRPMLTASACPACGHHHATAYGRNGSGKEVEICPPLHEKGFLFYQDKTGRLEADGNGGVTILEGKF
jgi:hypothetical protein